MKNKQQVASFISEGKACLGIELGSTRIKAVMIDENYSVIASGSHTWENRLENGIWTYHLSDVKTGLQDAYKNLFEDVQEKYGVRIEKFKAMCFSAMMHGYLVFDKDENQLTGFRTWRNTITAEAAEELTKLFSFNIPQRWSIAHLYQAILNGEAHVSEIAHLTTLAGYVHFVLTGEKVLGVGEASGVFPIDSEKLDYDEKMVNLFNEKLAEKGISWKLRDILPKVLVAGEKGGVLTKEGALYLDPTGMLQPGALLCAPEGDAGTGMTATNSVREKTGNISAGTSVFAMAVLEKALKGVYSEIDMVTTPTGKPVAMVHCNNCCSDIDAWVKLFAQFASLMGYKAETSELYNKLYSVALEGNSDCGGLVSFNYLSGEPVTGLEEGRPMFVRMPDSDFSLSNFMRDKLYSACATLKIGMDILFEKENVSLDKMFGHGGFFKTKDVGQSIMAAAMNSDVAVMETAGEGGAWGAAILADYAADSFEMTLEDYLDKRVFKDSDAVVMTPDAEDVRGFNEYMKKYKAAIASQKAAVENLK